MRNEPIQIEKYGSKVWCNAPADELRKTDCLCLNCKSLGDCPDAGGLYHIGKDSGVAFMVTRCKNWRKN